MERKTNVCCILLMCQGCEEHLPCIISFTPYSNLVRNELLFLGTKTENQGSCSKSNNDKGSHCAHFFYCTELNDGGLFS